MRRGSGDGGPLTDRKVMTQHANKTTNYKNIDDQQQMAMMENSEKLSHFGFVRQQTRKIASKDTARSSFPPVIPGGFNTHDYADGAGFQKVNVQSVPGVFSQYTPGTANGSSRVGSDKIFPVQHTDIDQISL